MLKGRCALITGSTQGLGYAMAERLAAEGCNIVMNGFGETDEIESRRHIAWNAAPTSSTRACGAISRSAAVCDTFCPCSSIPIRNQTWSPRSRRYRAIASAPTRQFPVNRHKVRSGPRNGWP